MPSLFLTYIQITTALNHITKGRKPLSLECGTKIPVKLWGTELGDMMNEGIVVVQKNELLCGVLDKNQFGASAFGLIHVSISLNGVRLLMHTYFSLSLVMSSMVPKRLQRC